MKTRQGFVSNSSSSSFIVAVPNKATKCKCCHRNDNWVIQAMFKYLTTLTTTGNKFVKLSNADEIVEYFEDELLNLIKSKSYAEEQLKIIEELESNPKVFDDYLRLAKQLDYIRNKSNLVDESTYGSNVYSDKLTERKKNVKQHLSEYDKKVSDLNEIIKKAKKYLKTDFDVYSFTIDNWATDAEEALKKMMADGVIKVIWSKYM